MSNKKGRRRRPESGYYKQLLALIDQYVDETGSRSAVDLRLVAAWAIQKGLWQPQREDKIKRLAKELSRASRDDYIPDEEEGGFVRQRVAYKVKSGDVQLTFWVMMKDATPMQMRNGAQWRRNGILADCLQLDHDMRYYNKHYNPGDPIQQEFNFNPDVEEKRHPGEYQDRAPDGEGDDED